MPTTVTASDGVGQFIIIPQSSGGTPYYILMPVQRQNQTSTIAIDTCASTVPSTVSVQGVQVKTESNQPKESGKVLSEEEPKLAAASDADRETTLNKGKDKDKSNLSVLSLVCSDLLDKDSISHEQANKEIVEIRHQNESLKATTFKQNVGKSVRWSPVNNGKQEVITPKSNDKKKPVKEGNLDKSPKALALTNTLVTPGGDRTMVENTTPRDYLPSFETPSVGSPLLFSIPANTYPIAPAEYVPIKRESSINNICNVNRAKHQHERFQLSQHGASFSQNQISMQQPYYGISPFITPPHSVTSSSNAYMAHQSPPFYQIRYTSQHMPQQVSPTSLSFAEMSNINAPQSHNHGYANASASPNGSDVSSSQGQKNYSNH